MSARITPPEFAQYEALRAMLGSRTRVCKLLGLTPRTLDRAVCWAHPKSLARLRVALKHAHPTTIRGVA